MAEAEVSGGDRFERAISDLQAKFAKEPVLSVGFLENATYPDGKSVAMIAAINEFGATIEREPSEITVYRKLNKAGTEFLRNGRFVKRREANFSSTHAVSAYTITIPPRPFFRGMVKDKSPQWGSDFVKLLKKADYDVQNAMMMMGEHIKGQLMSAINDFSDPANAPSTIRKKGFNKPLTDTATMRNNVDYAIDEN